MPILAFLTAIIAFLLVLLTTPFFIRFMTNLGLVVKDMNKKDKPLVTLSGGIPVLGGLLFGVFLYIFLRVFFFPSDYLFLDYKNLSLLLASLCSILIVTFIGFLDDIVIRSDKIESHGLRQWQKPLLTLFAAVPLMAVSAGNTSILIPFLGSFDLGIIYPLILIPIGVVGASNMVNLFAGFNGLEAGMGIVYIGMLGLYAFIHQNFVAALIALMTLFALIGFIFYNWYPAKILVGDSLTYLLGGVVAVIAIVGNMELVAVIASIPFFIEFLLKARSKFQAKSYGYYYNGKIKSYHKEIYSIPHLLTRTGKFTEKQVVWFGILISLIFSSLIWLV